MPDLSNALVYFETDASNISGTDPSWPEGMQPSKVNDSARALQGALRRFRDRIGPAIVSAGTANVQTLTYTVAPTAYVVGDIYSFTVGTGLTNTGATTLDVNGLGAKNIFLGANTLQGGELRETQFIMVGYDGTQFQLLRGITPASGGFLPSNPTGTASAGGVMMGIGGTCAVTPRVSGILQVHVVGDVGATGAGTSQMQIRYGTGTAPANGDALTGTTAGSLVADTTSTNNERAAFGLVAHITGLTVATAYWFDIRLSNSTGATSTTQNISVIVQEMSR